MLLEYLKQFIFDRPMLVMLACWAEGFVVGSFLVYYFFVQ